MTDNGTNGALRKIIELTLSNGVVVHVSPLSPYGAARLMRIAEEKYPDVPKAPYMNEHPDSVLPILDEPAWSSAQMKVLVDRRSLWSELVLAACVEVVGDQQAYVDAYAPQIARLRKQMELPEDEWAATLLYGVLENRTDINDLLDAAQGNMPLTASEVADGLKIFHRTLHQPEVGHVQS